LGEDGKRCQDDQEDEASTQHGRVRGRKGRAILAAVVESLVFSQGHTRNR
jgi:hypothetical protein